jgi:hypothetical protein
LAWFVAKAILVYFRLAARESSQSNLGLDHPRSRLAWKDPED